MILSETKERFERWHSYKANMILSCLEIVFWAIVPFMALSVVVTKCTGVACMLAWGVIVVAIIIQ
jgi:uncharacterized membrane protein